MYGFPDKYGELIDSETWACIERSCSRYPTDVTERSIEEQRRTYNTLCEDFHAGYPAGVNASDSFVPSDEAEVPVRNYIREGASPVAHVLYIHGGGFVLGGLESHDDVCAEFCDTANCNVTSVDYRLAPEHLHPAAFNDCIAAFSFLAGKSALPIILAGDSAGGTLAACVAHAARKMPVQPVGQLLVYPVLGHDLSLPSYREHENAPMLSKADIVYYHAVRGGGKDHDPTREPLSDNDFSGLPPTVIISAECDPLASDSEVYRQKLADAGNQVVWFNETGLVHGYLRARHTVERARRSFARMNEALVNLANGDWPYTS